jgi:hypothetical protein
MNDTHQSPASPGSKKEYWNHHIGNWRNSGLTQIQYCKEQQLKLSTFRYWKSRLKQLVLSKPLLPVTVSSAICSTTSSFPSGISLSVNDRVSIRLDVCFNQETLLSVLDLLESR